MTSAKRYDWAALAVILFAAGSLLAWLGTRGLAEPDEGRYASIGREMALQSDWLVPHLNGVGNFQKPPLHYWTTALCVKALGANEWAVRMPSALGAFGTVLLVMYMAGVLFGPACRWKAGLILLTAGEFFILAHVVNTDMLLTFWITASITGLVAYTQRGRTLGLVAYYLCMGLAFLTKGPMALVVTVSAGVLCQYGYRRAGRVPPRLYWLLGLPLALGLGLIWFILLIHRHPALLDYFVRYEFIDRVASNVHRRGKPFYYLPLCLAGGMLPWSPFLLMLVRPVWQRLQQRQHVHIWLFVGWCVVPLIIMSLVKSKLATYLLPVFPPLSLALAAGWDRLQGGRAWRFASAGVAVFLTVLCLGTPPALIHAQTLYSRQIDLPAWFAAGLAVALVLALCLPVLARRAAWQTRVLPWIAVSMVAILVTFLANMDHLMLGGNAPIRRLAAGIRARPDGAAIPVFACDVRVNSLEFYLQRLVARSRTASDVVLPLDEAQAARLPLNPMEQIERMRHAPGLVLMKDRRFLAETSLTNNWHVIDKSGRNVLLANDAAIRVATSGSP